MTDIFERHNLDDLRILDDDLYLQMNESRSGCVIFNVPTESIEFASEAEVEICVGDSLYLKNDISSLLK
jgi:hypothetical protein